MSLWNLAAWDDRDVLTFAPRAGRNSAVADSGRRIEADSLDNLLGKAPLTFLKMDVEGSESRAILGSANAIRRHKPKLMVSAYHRSEDLFALPLQIQRIQPGYRFYLRRFPYIPAWEINPHRFMGGIIVEYTLYDHHKRYRTWSGELRRRYGQKV